MSQQLLRVAGPHLDHLHLTCRYIDYNAQPMLSDVSITSCRELRTLSLHMPIGRRDQYVARNFLKRANMSLATFPALENLILEVILGPSCDMKGITLDDEELAVPEDYTSDDAQDHEDLFGKKYNPWAPRTLKTVSHPPLDRTLARIVNRTNVQKIRFVVSYAKGGPPADGGAKVREVIPMMFPILRRQRCIQVV